MVANGAVELTSLKAKFGADIRRTALRHSNDLTHNDLVLLLQRIFSIDPAAPVALKYRDSDGDLVSLTNDDDVLHAVQTSNGSLFVHVFATDDSKQELFELERQLEELIARAGNVLESVRSGSLFGPSTETLSAPSKPVARADHHDHRPSSPLSSPRQNVATIQPSLQQQVFADGQAHKVGSEASQVEEDIPLDNSFNQYNHVNDFAPPPPPASNDFAPPPTSQTPQNFGPPPTFTNQQPPQFSSQPLSHPPVPQQPEQQAPPNFGPPSGIPSFPQSQAPPPAPTQQPPSNPSAPPPSNFPNFYQQQPQHEATPTPPPVQQQFYAPPTSQQSVQPPQPPTSQGFAPSGPPQYSTGYTATPPPAPTYTQPTSQFTPPTSQYGAPPSQFGAPPGQFSAPSQGFAPPNSAPGSFAPPPTSAPSFAPPGGFPGGPGGPPPVGPPGPGYGGQPNPFGPRPGQPGAYRSSPYQM